MIFQISFVSGDFFYLIAFQNYFVLQARMNIESTHFNLMKINSGLSLVHKSRLEKPIRLTVITTYVLSMTSSFVARQTQVFHTHKNKEDKIADTENEKRSNQPNVHTKND